MERTMNPEELKSSDLKTEVDHPEIRASATSDVLPTNECDHSEGGLIPNAEGKFSVIEFTYCPECGEKL